MGQGPDSWGSGGTYHQDRTCRLVLNQGPGLLKFYLKIVSMEISTSSLLLILALWFIVYLNIIIFSRPGKRFLESSGEVGGGQQPGADGSLPGKVPKWFKTGK